MSPNNILALIDAEIASLQQARALITGATTKKRPGRTKGTAVTVAKPKQKRKISPEGLARIAAAQKARWAAQRKTAR